MAIYKKICVGCNEPFDAARSTAKYHNDACKKKYQRRAKTPNATVESGPQNSTFNVKDYGAVGDGIVDDTAAIQAAVDAAAEALPKKQLSKAKAPIVNDTSVLRETTAEHRTRMNERLRAKGLPLILDGPEVMHFVPTGVPLLDGLTAEMDVNKVGGFPRKKITEIYGPKGSGKSSLVKLIHKAHPELKILFFDAEGGLIAPPENVEIVKGNVVEEIMPALIDLAASGDEYDLIIVDSVASLVTKKQFDDEKEGIAPMARVFGPYVKQLVAHLQPIGPDGAPADVPGTAVVFINQFRDTTNTFGKKEYTVGGRSLEYYASLRLIFRSASKDHIIRNGQIAGQQVRVTTDKTRFGKKLIDEKFPLMFDVLQDYNDYYVNKLKEMGLR